MQLPQVNPIGAAVGKLAQRLSAVESESLPVGKTAGRILAQPLSADRDSPALDVSAMDGYALRIQDVHGQPLPVAGTTPAGSAPALLSGGTAVQIFTGAPIPQGADCVVRREDTTESPDQVTIHLPVGELVAGRNIRRRGENIRQGETVLEAGRALDCAAMAAMASFAPPHVRVHRRVRVTVLNTGDELAQPGEPVEDWQIRDSNGPTLQTWLEQLPWIDFVGRTRVADRPDVVRDALVEHTGKSDAVILTGGVSMGDTDYVPDAIRAIGGEIAFHRLPIRPGKPVLGASLDGRLILGLPGNPVSVAVTSRVFGQPLLSALAGRRPQPLRPSVTIQNPDTKTLDLTWYRLIQTKDQGQVGFVASKGSGDLVALAQSDGFVEVPPGQAGPGPWPLTLWT